MSTFERFREVFNGEGGDYDFTMSHITIGGHNVKRELARDGTGEWVLTQHVGGRTYVVRHQSDVAAVLLLIAAQLGLTGELHAMPEDDDDA